MLVDRLTLTLAECHQGNRSNKRTNPASSLKHRSTEQEIADEPSQKRTSNSEQHGSKNPHRLTTWVDGTCDGADQQTKNHPTNNPEHLFTSEAVCLSCDLPDSEVALPVLAAAISEHSLRCQRRCNRRAKNFQSIRRYRICMVLTVAVVLARFQDVTVVRPYRDDFKARDPKAKIKR